MTEIQMDFTEMFPSTKREGIENANHGDGSSNSLPRTIEQETETL